VYIPFLLKRGQKVFYFISAWIVLSVITAIIFTRIVNSRKRRLEKTVLFILRESLYEPLTVEDLTAKVVFCSRDDIFDAVINLQMDGKARLCSQGGYTFKENNFI
jgi:hypothetical protein